MKMNEEQERKEWKERMKYLCKEAENSPMAAEIEAIESGIGFRGERLKSHPDPKLKYIKLERS